MSDEFFAAPEYAMVGRIGALLVALHAVDLPMGAPADCVFVLASHGWDKWYRACPHKYESSVVVSRVT